MLIFAYRTRSFKEGLLMPVWHAEEVNDNEGQLGRTTAMDGGSVDYAGAIIDRIIERIGSGMSLCATLVIVY